MFNVIRATIDDAGEDLGTARDYLLPPPEGVGHATSALQGK
jgi:hypothetical protein